MTLKEKKEFCNELINGTKKMVMERLDRTPKSWTGIELRWFVNEIFDTQCVFGHFRDKKTKRYKEYHNDVAVNCL